MSNPQNPQNRPVWNDSDIEAGEFASLDNGQLQIARKVKAGETIPFGVIVDNDGGEIRLPNNVVETAYSVGVSMISNQVKNYAEREYLEGEIAAVGRRGFVVVKIDTAEPPVTGPGTIYVSREAGKEGYLTNLANVANAREINGVTAGIEIIRVGSETAEVYLAGNPFMASVET